MDKTIAMLKKNLDSEFRSVRFYIDNLQKLDYKTNKKKIDKLAIDSLKHAKRIVSLILELSEKDTSKITKKAKDLALTEEKALSELYRYELSKAFDPRVKAFLRKQIREEKTHEKIAQSLR